MKLLKVVQKNKIYNQRQTYKLSIQYLVNRMQTKSDQQNLENQSLKKNLQFYNQILVKYELFSDIVKIRAVCYELFIKIWKFKESFQKFLKMCRQVGKRQDKIKNLMKQLELDLYILKFEQNQLKLLQERCLLKLFSKTISPIMTRIIKTILKGITLITSLSFQKYRKECKQIEQLDKFTQNKLKIKNIQQVILQRRKMLKHQESRKQKLIKKIAKYQKIQLPYIISLYQDLLKLQQDQKILKQQQFQQKQRKQGIRNRRFKMHFQQLYEQQQRHRDRLQNYTKGYQPINHKSINFTKSSRQTSSLIRALSTSNDSSKTSSRSARKLNVLQNTGQMEQQ